MQKAQPRLIRLVAMPKGAKSSKKKKHKPNPRQRYNKQAQDASASNPYVLQFKEEETHSWKPTLSGVKPKRFTCHLVRDDVSCLWPQGLKPKLKAKAQSDDDMDNAATPGVCNADEGVIDIEDEDEEDIEEEDPIEDEDDIEEEDPIDLSRRMANFLRHTAYKDGLLDEDDWLPLSDALPRLQCNEEEVAQVVKQSDRHDDCLGCGARFEMFTRGSSTWIRATDGEYYRSRGSVRIRSR